MVREVGRSIEKFGNTVPAIGFPKSSRGPNRSRISGRIRLHPLARVFLIVILAAAVLMPVGALFESVPLEDWHHHVVRAGQMLAIGTVIAVAGILMLGGGLHVLGRHIVAFLDAAAHAGGKSTPT